MSEPIPDWITNDFLTQVLQKEAGYESVVVKHFTPSLAVAPGNNYGSTIIRLQVEFMHQDTLKSVSLIVKAEIADGPVKDIFTDLYSGEPIFYYKFIPLAKKLLDMSFVPKAFVSPRPKDIILEDLKERGYLMKDRTKQLDFDHCSLYMAAAAKLHAVSVAVFKQHPEMTTALGDTKIFTNNKETVNMFKTSIKYSLEILAEETDKIHKFKKYSNTIKELSPHLYDMILEAHKPREGLKTLNQGDPWTTNMMFKYDKHGKVSGIKLLDFQCQWYASPVYDIVFFIWTSANNTVKKNHLNEIYKIYLSTFNDMLEQLNCTERMTLEEFMEGIRLLSPEAFYWAGVPTIICPNPMDFGMYQQHQASGNDQELRRYYRDKVFNKDFCTNQLPDLLECLEINGIFECLKEKIQ